MINLTKEQQEQMKRIYGNDWDDIDIPPAWRNKEEEREEDIRFAERAARDAEKEKES